MTAPGEAPGPTRAAEVTERLGRVSDPELDEPVTELGFVTHVTVAGGAVTVGFRLPTYWCAANFAFLMADDMRTEVLRLPWVSEIRVVLGEHMYADTINAAMERGQSFQEAFGAEADGGLDEVRRTFLVKAFQRRQMTLLDHLLQAGHAPDALLAMSVAGLRSLPLGAEGARLVARYLDRRGVPGPDGPDEAAFVDAAGSAVAPERFAQHRRALRSVAVGVEFNGSLCRGLLAARFDESLPDGEPTFMDFAHGRVKARAAG